MVTRTNPPEIARARQDIWRDFMRFVDRHEQANWVFRGVADADGHLLVPKVGRDSQKYEYAVEKVIFANFRRRARQFVDTSQMTGWDLMALAQHPGLPTRLLDWTTNPLVAAYFSVTSLPRDKTARIYAARAPQLIDIAAVKSPFDCQTVAAFIPSSVAPRIVAQRGLFTIHPKPTEPWGRGLKPGKSGPPPDDHQFDIPLHFRPFFEGKLFQLAIDAAAIKSDLDGICDTLAWQFQNGFAVGKFNY